MSVRNLVLGLSLLTVCVTSCIPARKAYRSGDLLLENKVKITEKKSEVKSSDLTKFAIPVPNTKFLGLFRMKLYMYELGTLNYKHLYFGPNVFDLHSYQKEDDFKNLLQNIWGEPPVYVDTTDIDNTIVQFKQELFNLGYFHPEITYSVKQRNKKHPEDKITYFVTPNAPCRYNDISFNISDPEVDSIAFKGRSKSVIKTDGILNSYILDNERSRISNVLRNEGYYFFSKDLVTFTVDTNLMSNKANITVDIHNPVLIVDDKPKEQDFRKYYIRNVNIYSNFDPEIDYRRTYENDIIVSQFPAKDTITKGEITFYNIGKEKINPDVLLNAIYTLPGNLYRQEVTNFTTRSLVNIPAIRYATVTYSPVGSVADSLLDCDIRITRKKLHSNSIDTEVTNNGGRLGFGMNLTYSNRNIFTGGESFLVATSGGLEIQFGNGIDSIINTAQASLTSSLFFPRILLPWDWGKMPGYYSPQTNIDVGFSYQKRAGMYDRIILNTTFGYRWKFNFLQSNYASPLDFSYVRINKTPEFEHRIITMRSSIYESQYTSHTLLGVKYTYTTSNQSAKVTTGDYHYLRLNGESSGNLLNGIAALTQQTKDESGNYHFLGVPYAQFVLGELEYKYYHYFTPKTCVVLRFASAIGIPYGNSWAMPVEKACYAGGANDMRGWGLKLLGPGSAVNYSPNYERVGDISLKANVEFRFPLSGVFNMAVFADAGNIWLLNEDDYFYNGNFEFNRFYKEIAVDVGVGLRLDFNFFVLRLDAGCPFFDPCPRYYLTDDGEMILPFSFSLLNTKFNLAIGYPF